MELKRDKKIELGESVYLAPHSFVNRKFGNFSLTKLLSKVNTCKNDRRHFMKNTEEIKVLLAHIVAFAVFCVVMSLLMWLGTY